MGLSSSCHSSLSVQLVVGGWVYNSWGKTRDEDQTVGAVWIMDTGDFDHR